MRALYERTRTRLELAAADLEITLFETPRHNWGIRGLPGDELELGYKVGVRVNLDVLNAQTQLYTTQRDLARARYDLILTNLRLRQAAGTLKPEDVASVNRYLAP